jgi:hypothetical protein
MRVVTKLAVNIKKTLLFTCGLAASFSQIGGGNALRGGVNFSVQYKDAYIVCQVQAAQQVA